MGVGNVSYSFYLLSEATMAKATTGISKKELLDRLSAARELFPYALPGGRRRSMKEPNLSKLAKSQSSLASMFLPPQFDTKKFEKLQKECSLELDRIGNEREAAAVKASGQFKKTLRAYMESQRIEMERLGKPELLDPFLIWGITDNPQILHLTSFEWDLRQHWARGLLDGKYVGNPSNQAIAGGGISFYYPWTNNNNYPVRIWADTSLLLNGWCRARAEGYWGAALPGIPGSRVGLKIYTGLIAWQWWTNPPIPFPGQLGDVMFHWVEKFEVEGGVFGHAWEPTIGEADSFFVSNMEVPPRAWVVFEVYMFSEHRFFGTGETRVAFGGYPTWELRNPYLAVSFSPSGFHFPHPFPFPT
jgi:hypothetical protein